MVKNNLAYLKHILDSIQRIEDYTLDTDYDEFMESSLIQAATIREIEIIGEATKNLETSFKAKHRAIPWKKMSGMRDKLIHEYFGVDLDAVWDTIKIDIPPLKDKMDEIIKNIE